MMYFLRHIMIIKHLPNVWLSPECHVLSNVSMRYTEPRSWHGIFLRPSRCDILRLNKCTYIQTFSAPGMAIIVVFVSNRR